MSTHTATRTAESTEPVLSEITASQHAANALHPLMQAAFSTSCAIESLEGKGHGFAITERVVLHSSRRRYRK